MGKEKIRRELKTKSKIIEEIRNNDGVKKLSMPSTVFIAPGDPKYGSGDIVQSDYGCIVFSAVVDLELLIEHPHEDVRDKSVSIIRYLKQKCQSEFIKEHSLSLNSGEPFFLDDLKDIDRKNGVYGPKSLQEIYLKKYIASLEKHKPMALLKIAFNASPESVDEYEISITSGISFVKSSSGNPSIAEGDSILESTFIYTKAEEVLSYSKSLADKLNASLSLHLIMLPARASGGA